MHTYLPEWDIISFSKTYQAPNIDKYHVKGSHNQLIYYFYSLIGNAMGNDELKTRLFVRSLKGIAFDWLCTLPIGSIKS